MTNPNPTRAIFHPNQDGTVDAELTDSNGTTTQKRFATVYDAAEVGFTALVMQWEPRKDWK